MTITPVTPKDREQLVPTTTALIFDATENVVTVTFNSVTIWSGGAPQNGWLGYTIVHPGGTRYVFDPPAPFNVGDFSTVIVTGASSTLMYQFVVGLRQITTTDDASVGRVAEAGPPAPAAATPTWWLKLDDAASPPVDFIGAFTFAVVGAPTFQQGGAFVGSATSMLLNGSPDAVRAQASDPLKTQRFSLSLWVNPTGSGAQRTIASCGRAVNKGWVLRRLAGGALELRAFDGATSSAATSGSILGATTWAHVVIVVDIANNIFRIFINSVREADVDPAITAISYETNGGSDEDDLFLGYDTLLPAENWQGRFDQVRFFNNVALTDAQVAVLYQEATGPLRPPWIGYSREPGNIYLRKDEPLTAEVLTVPGDKVDVGYNETTNEIEVLYIHNGKVFVVAGQGSESPSTLTQPSVLKNDMKTGGLGSGRQTFVANNFTPIKMAPTPENLTTGGLGTGEHSFGTPPTAAVPGSLLGTPVLVLVPPTTDPRVTFVRLFKKNAGSTIFLAEYPASTEIQVFEDVTFVVGDSYLTQLVYGDVGASKMRRLTAPSVAAHPSPGDLMKTGGMGDAVARYTPTTFPPLKLATPTDNALTGFLGDNGDRAFMRTWYSPTAAAATLAAPIGGHIVVTGLTEMGRQHLYLYLNIAGAADALNNGAFRIVEILSETSVRVYAPSAVGADANNGALTWSLSGPLSDGPTYFIAINTVDIGVG